MRERRNQDFSRGSKTGEEMQFAVHKKIDLTERTSIRSHTQKWQALRDQTGLAILIVPLEMSSSWMDDAFPIKRFGMIHTFVDSYAISGLLWTAHKQARDANANPPVHKRSRLPVDNSKFIVLGTNKK